MYLFCMAGSIILLNVFSPIQTFNERKVNSENLDLGIIGTLKNPSQSIQCCWLH